MESFVLFSSVPQRRTAIGFYCSVWSILFNAFHSLAEFACWKTNETTGMWENIKTMLKGRKLDINFKSHKKAKKSLSKNSHEKNFSASVKAWIHLKCPIPMNVSVVFCSLQITCI